MQTSYIVSLNEENFQHVLQNSVETPVLFNFWAPMSPESAELTPVLEKIAHEYAGVFILANINCEEQRMLAMQFGVQTLPTIALFSNGQPVDGLGGPQTEEAVRDMLTRHLPNQDELTLKKAQGLIAEANFNDALLLLKPLKEQLGEQGAFKLALAECYIETQQFEQAEALLTAVLMQDQDAKFKELIAKIELFKQAMDTPEIRELQQAYEQNPSDFNIGYELAIQFNQVNKQEDALTILIKILQSDVNYADGDVKKTTMDILASLGQGNEIASRFRRQLYALLY